MFYNYWKLSGRPETAISAVVDLESLEMYHMAGCGSGLGCEVYWVGDYLIVQRDRYLRIALDIIDLRTLQPVEQPSIRDPFLLYAFEMPKAPWQKGTIFGLLLAMGVGVRLIRWRGNRK